MQLSHVLGISRHAMTEPQPCSTAPPSEQFGPVSYRRGKDPQDFQGWVFNVGCKEAELSS